MTDLVDNTHSLDALERDHRTRHDILCAGLSNQRCDCDQNRSRGGVSGQESMFASGFFPCGLRVLAAGTNTDRTSFPVGDRAGGSVLAAGG